MDFQDKFARVFCGLFSVLQVSSSQLTDLSLEAVNIPKALRIPELNPVSKFRLGPFESVDDRFYNSAYYAKSVVGGKRTKGRLIGFEEGKQPERMTSGNREVSNLKTHNGDEESEKQNGDQLKWMTNKNPSQTSEVLVQTNDINSQIKQLETMSKLLKNVKAEISNMEKSLAVDSFEKLFKKIPSGDKMENKVKISDTNTVKEMNNIMYNNRYLIGNIFIINRLSEANNSSLKETDVEILKELTARKMKELLEKTVNNLTGDGIPKDEVPAVTQSPHYEYEMALLKQLQRNFSKMFNRQNVTLEHVNQMSKIIDFVERYHGTVGDLKPSNSHGRDDANREGPKENSYEVFHDARPDIVKPQTE